MPKRGQPTQARHSKPFRLTFEPRHCIEQFDEANPVSLMRPTLRHPAEDELVSAVMRD